MRVIIFLIKYIDWDVESFQFFYDCVCNRVEVEIFGEIKFEFFGFFVGDFFDFYEGFFWFFWVDFKFCFLQIIDDVFDDYLFEFIVVYIGCNDERYF